MKHLQRLVSLWDIMINYGLGNLSTWIPAMNSEEKGLLALDSLAPCLVDTVKFIELLLPLIGHECRVIGARAALHRLIMFDSVLRNGNVTNGEMAFELKALRQAIDGDFKSTHLYLYSERQAGLILSFGADWESILKRFASVRDDAFAATDCCALGHGTASVFHSMRVAEIGLRVLAKERRVRLPRERPIELAEWRAIIDATEKKAAELRNCPVSAKRDDAVSFYQGALGELQAFKDVYRNNVCHTRDNFDDNQALSVLTHVRGLMGRLAARLDENSTKQIAWKIR